MNPTSDSETEAIRSDIDSTRQNMDRTMDALKERLQGRHLIDEVLGYFRNEPERGREIGQKITQSANSAMHSITDTVKANPVPALLIGVGVGWLIYQNRSQSSRLDDDYSRAFSTDDGYGSGQNDPDAESLYDRPLEYPSSAAQPSNPYGSTGYSAGGTSSEPTSSGFAPGEQSKLGQAKDQIAQKASHATEQVKQRLSEVGSRVRDRSHAVGEQARQLGSRVQERARETYQRSRERVAITAQEHPLELGLACLAVGVIAGLSIPTPQRLNRLAGPSVDRLRDRTRQAGSELLHKGQRVASAAVEAARNEAQVQGLTPESKDDRSDDPSGDEASGKQNPGGAASQPQPDPLASRPVM